MAARRSALPTESATAEPGDSRGQIVVSATQAGGGAEAGWLPGAHFTEGGVSTPSRLSNISRGTAERRTRFVTMSLVSLKNF